MAKRYTHNAGDVLTPEKMDAFVQTCQVSNTLTPTGVAEPSDKLVPSIQLLNTVVNGSQTFTGSKTFAGEVRIGLGNSGGKISFGDADYVHLYESPDDVLEVKASTLNLNGVNAVNLTGKKINARDIVFSSSYFGGASNLQEILLYIGMVFGGTKKLSALDVSNLSTDNLNVR